MVLPGNSLFNSANMTAKDLFAENLIQVFSRKKGHYLGVVRVGEMFDFGEEEPAEDQPEEVKINPAQISLF